MSVPSSTPQFSGIAVVRPHRADARRNFDALLAAARDAFNRDGIDVPLEDIARQAGVGIGTLYRNFPTRSDLVEAVYVSEIEELLQAARDAIEREPWDALETWLRRFSGYVATKLAMLQGLNKDSEMFRACRAAMYETANPLFERAQAAGEVRKDTNLDDVMRLVSGVTASHYESDEQRARVLTLALDAIRTPRPPAKPARYRRRVGAPWGRRAPRRAPGSTESVPVAQWATLRPICAASSSANRKWMPDRSGPRRCRRTPARSS